MMRFFRVFTLLTFSLIAVCHADDAGIPDIVLKGFETYQKFGTVSGVDAWFKGSAFEAADKDAVTAKMAHVESTYGTITGYELLRTVRLTPSTRRVYVAAKFNKGVAWMFFDCYKPATDWIILRLEFSTKADEVIPMNILTGQ